MSGAVLVHISDVHDGEDLHDVTPEQLRARVESVPEQLAGILTERPDELCLVLNGDLVTGGGIYPSQRAEALAHERQQVDDAASCYARMLRATIKRFPRAMVSVVVIGGNHGRVEKRAHPESNWDLVVGDRLRDKMQRERRCSVRVEDWVEYAGACGGTRFVAIHRQPVKPSDANAAQGRVARRLRHHDAHIALYAHYHDPKLMVVDGIVMAAWNGSMCGTTRLSAELGYYTPAQQMAVVCRGGPVREDDVRWLRW